MVYRELTTFVIRTSLFDIRHSMGCGPVQPFDVVFFVLHPRRQPLAQSLADFPVLAGDVHLFQRVAVQVVELIAAKRGIVDVFPWTLAHGQQIVIASRIEVGTWGPRRIEQASPLPAVRGAGS